MKTKTKPTKNGTAKRSSEEKKLLFVEAYLSNGGNLTKAALAAGYTPKSASQQGYRMSKDHQIMSMIEQRSQVVAKKYELNTEMLIRSIVQEMEFDPASLYDENGKLKDIRDLDKDTRMALQSIEFEQRGGGEDEVITVRKVKWASRKEAREQGMRFLGMFEKDNKQKGGMLADLPRELLQLMVERLKTLNAEPIRIG